MFQDVIVIAQSFDVDNAPSVGSLVAALSATISDGSEEFTAATALLAPLDQNGFAAVAIPSNVGVNPSNTYYAIGFDTIGGKYIPEAYVIPNTGLSALLSGSGAPSSGTGSNAEYYLDTVGETVYGPKASGAWPAGIAVVGLEALPIGVLLLASIAPATQGAPMNTFVLETAVGASGGVMATPSGTPEAGQVPVWDGAGEETVWGTLTGGVPSVFGRIGAITAEGSDYAAFYDDIGAAAAAQTAAEAASDPAGSASSALASAQTYATNAANAAKNAAEAASDPAGSAATAQATAESFATAAVGTEATARAAGDSTNATAIAAETTRAEAAEASLATSSALSAEVTRAEGAEATNATAISAETSRAETAEALAAQKSANLSDLANEATARTNLGLGTAATHAATDFDAAGAAATAQTNAETFATSAVATETTRAEGVEATLATTTALTTETTARTTGDSAVAATAAAEVAASIFPSAGKYPALHKVFARVMCGAQDQKVLLLGDSTYQGVWADFGQGPVPYIVNALTAAGINAAFGLAAAPGSGFSDPRWAAGSGWTQGTGITNAGWAGLDTLWQGANGASGILSFQPDAGVFDTFDIYYLTSTGAYGFHVNFNGGTDTVVNANTGAFSVAKVTVSGSPTATPICNIHAPSGFGATIVGVEARLSTVATLRIGNAGISGATTAGWVSTPGTLGYGALDCVKAFAPDLTIIGLGINDLYAATSTSTILANIATLITACQISGSVVLATENPFTTATVSQAIQDAYWAAYRAFAASNGYPLIDVYGAWGGAAAFTTLASFSYYGDGVIHPSAGEGQPDAGRVIAAGLLRL